MEKKLFEHLKKKGIVLCTVESCTGGLIAADITDQPGSSEIFWGAFITYDNSAKISTVNVSADLIEKHGAVSEEVASALAEGGLLVMTKTLATTATNSSSNFKNRDLKKLVCIATTGVAGPGGGTPKKPVGLCFAALARPEKPTIVRKIIAPKFRNQPRTSERFWNKNHFARKTLELLESEL